MKQAYDFPVETRDIKIEGGIKVEGRKAVVRLDTEKPTPIAVVSDKYKIVPHKDVIETFTRVKGIKEVKVSVCKRGALLLGDYDFNNGLSKQEVAVGDTVQFGLRVFNSYDMTTGVGFEVTALRLVCSNGLLVPSKVARFSFKHFENVEINGLEDSVKGRLSESVKVVEEWGRWLKTVPTEARIKKFFEEAKGLGDKDKEKLSEASIGLKNRNVWEIYNTVTAHLSHDLKFRKEEEKVATIRRREQVVLPKFHSFKWN